MNEINETFELMKKNGLIEPYPCNETNPWHKVSDELPKDGVEVIGYSKDWINEDFNPNGTRACFLNEGDWISAFWWDYQDTYITISEREISANPSFFKEHIGKTDPTHWMYIPTIKED